MQQTLNEEIAAPRRGWWTVAAVLVVAALTLLAWSNRFVQDDAFISFRYADSLARGLGPVWNPGERVEGYTNFLWMVLISVGLRLGADAVALSYALGLACFAGSLLLTWRAAELLLARRDLALLTMVLLGTNFTFSSYATGGLETQLQAMLFAAMVLLTVRAWVAGRCGSGSMALLSVAAGAAFLTRMDSALAIILLLPAAAGAVWRRTARGRRRWVRLAALLLPAAGIAVAWLAWKLQYYGDVFPNTFYAKTGSSAALFRGTYYLYAFLLSYLLVPFALLLAAAWRTLLERAHRPVLLLAVVAVVWTAYVVKVGGGFMEFRFFVPILPLLMVLVVWVLFRFVSRPAVRWALLGVLVVGWVNHPVTFGEVNFTRGIMNVDALRIRNKQPTWEQVGQALGEAFDPSDDVLMATTAAGAIPYYSRLRTVDMLGLNDPWVARHGVHYVDRPGHTKIAPVSHLEQRGVHLLVSYPWTPPPDRELPPALGASQLEKLCIVPPEPSELPQSATGLVIPVGREQRLVVLYLMPCEAMDRAIREHGWRRIPIEGR
jgi:hypothetical protein